MSASQVFALTVVEAGRIESTLLPVFSRTSPQQELSVRLSAKPDKKVTISLSVSDAAAISTGQLTFGSSDWNVWQTVQVSLSAATTVRKEDLDFVVSVAVHEAASGDELYLQTAPVEVAGRYEGPGNNAPRISTTEVRVNENAGDEQTVAGSKIGTPVSATDEDNEDASLKYGIEPVSSQFGIGTSDGQISLKVDTNFDYEDGTREYTLTVKVEDPEGGSVKGEVKVSIADINEVPELGEIGSRRAIIGHEFEMTFAPATDEDTGQSHTYSASLASGEGLPKWLVFAGSDRKFTIGSDASGITAATYQISVSATDDGSPQLSASQIFALTVVEAGRIESTLLPVFSRTSPEQELSVRLSVRSRTREVTVTLSISDGSVASVAPQKVVFDGNDWNSWKVAQVSISSETQESKDGIAFAVTVSVHDAETGDELYMHTEAVQVAGTYEGSGNKLPEITTDEIVLNENAGDEQTVAGSKIGTPVSATDEDNEDANLKYGVEPVSSLFGIGTSDGQITLKADTNFDYEGGTREYTLTVKVEDPEGGSVKGEVKISIADINEAPELGEIGSRRAIIGHEFEMTFAPATDEDTGQSHTYSASLTDGEDLPTWLVFAGSDRKFTIGSSASGITAATYQISVSATDDGTLPLSASQVFALTVVEAGRIESNLLPVFNRAGPEQELSVRLSVRPDKEVTVTLSMSDGSVASVAPLKVVFDGNDWNSWKVAQVSISSETQERKDGIAFAVTVLVHDAETGDELYMHTEAVQVAGTYEGPGNKLPEITTDEIVLNENAGDEQTVAGSKIGTPVSATDEDNEDANLKYGVEPVSSLFGIGTSDGQITLKADTNFDYEGGTREYTLTVKVEDPEGGSVKGEVKISIADINEAPELGEIGSRRAIIGHEFEMTFAPATDEDTGQSHTYSASLADGGNLPTWLVFAGSDRKFTIGSGASGITAATYQISVDVADSGTPPLSASRVFALTVVEAGRIESTLLPVFSRAGPEQELSVRLSVRPDKEVTVTLRMSDGSVASVAPLKVVFDGNDWNSWKVAQVSISSETQERKDGIAFAVTVSVHDAENGDELYMHTEAVQVAGTYEGPGNSVPELAETVIQIKENDGDEKTVQGTKIGKPISAMDSDNEDATLVYSIAPESELFGIGSQDGQITLKVATNFNYEEGPRQYTVTVKVEDADGGANSLGISISIADINEAPELGEIENQRAIIGQEFELMFASAMDEDTGQKHAYQAELADGKRLPSWLGFAGLERKFTIVPDATGVVAGEYRISVSVTDDGSPVLSANVGFVLTVVEAGQIEVRQLPGFDSANTVHDLSVRLSAQPSKPVTLTLTPSDAAVAAVRSSQLVFAAADWNQWQMAQVSISPATQASKTAVEFAITLAVQDASSGDQLYMRTAAVKVPGQYAGAGNKAPQLPAIEISIRENMGNAQSASGMKIGEALAAMDADNEAASLLYSIEPASDLFDIWSGRGQIVLKKENNFNYEQGPRAYALTVVVRDPEGGATSSNVQIRVTDINEPPQLAHVNDQRIVAGQDLSFEFEQAEDEDLNQQHHYILNTAGGGPLPRWIKFDAEQLRFSAFGADDGAATGKYDFELIVYDDGTPILSDTKRFQLHVLDGGGIEVLPISNMNIRNRKTELLVRLTVEPKAAVTISLASLQPSIADIEVSSLEFAPGQWNVFQPVMIAVSDAVVARDENASYAIELAVHDASNGDHLYRNAQEITVSGNYYGDGNVDPSVRPQVIVLDENAEDEMTSAGTVLGRPIIASDQDHQFGELSYELLDDHGIFEIGEVPEESLLDIYYRAASGPNVRETGIGIELPIGQLMLKENFNFDFETQNLYMLTVVVRDPAGGEGQAYIMVNIKDRLERQNQAPDFASAVFYIDENVGDETTPADMQVGDAIVAKDEDATLSYSMINPSDSFYISQLANGMVAVMTKQEAHFDYEARSSYILTLGAMDSQRAMGMATIAIMINDLPEDEAEETTAIPEELRQYDLLLVGYIDRAINSDLVAMVRRPPASVENSSSAGPAAEQPVEFASPWDEFAATEEKARYERTKPFEALVRHGFSYTLAKSAVSDAKAKIWTSGRRSSADVSSSRDNKPHQYSGTVNTGAVGFEMEMEKRTKRVGFAVAFSRSDFGFSVEDKRLEVERDLLTFYPYISWDVNPQTQFWGMIGLGTGEYVSRHGAAKGEHDTSMFSVSGGINHNWEYEKFDFVLGARSAGTYSTLEEKTVVFTNQKADTIRTHFDLEIARPSVWEEEKLTFRPFIKLQGRIDSGDIVKGAFGDIAGGAELQWERGLKIRWDGLLQIRKQESKDSRSEIMVSYDFDNDGRGLILEMNSLIENSQLYESEKEVFSSRLGSRIGWGMPAKLFGVAGDAIVEFTIEDDVVSEWGWKFKARKFNIDFSVHGEADAKLNYSYNY